MQRNVVIIRKDADGKPAAGSRLQILDGGGEVLEEWICTGDMTMYSRMLPPGSYVLHEEEAPPGCTAAEDISFCVGQDGSLSIYGMPAGSIVMVSVLRPGCIYIGKKIYGSLIDRIAAECTVTAELAYSDGMPYTGPVIIRRHPGRHKEKTSPGRDGRIHIVLQHGCMARLSGIPAGVRYRITEEDRPDFDLTLSGAVGRIMKDPAKVMSVSIRKEKNHAFRLVPPWLRTEEGRPQDGGM